MYPNVFTNSQAAQGQVSSSMLDGLQDLILLAFIIDFDKDVEGTLITFSRYMKLKRVMAEQKYPKNIKQKNVMRIQHIVHLGQGELDGELWFYTSEHVQKRLKV